MRVSSILSVCGVRGPIGLLGPLGAWLWPHGAEHMFGGPSLPSLGGMVRQAAASL